MFRPLPQDDPTQRCPDIGRARSVLGWQPEVDLEDGLVRTIAHFDRLLSGGPARAVSGGLVAG